MESMQKEKFPSQSVISKMTKYMVMLFVLCLLSNVKVYAQSNGISGTVVDVQGEPLIGATVIIPGTKAQTLTDLDGKYNIAAKSGDILEFTYVGMLTQKVKVGNSSVINVTLKDDDKLLDEIVVIGYGTSKKADLTGSIGSIRGKDILKQPALSPLQSAQGKIAGVSIIGNDAPGSSPNVTIRGLGTALGGREPLYIVDGFPVDNIKNISSSDILTMDVLKDASSASIYGVRAANGVIIITTKRGESGSSKITVNSQFGLRTTLNKVKMANASEYVEFFNENRAMLRAYASTPAEAAKITDLATNQPYDTDWYDELLRTAIYTDNTVSISGGSKNVNYFLSYNYFKEDASIKGYDYNRSTIRNNNDYKFFNDRLTISQTLNISFGRHNLKQLGAFTDAYRMTPLVPVYFEDGLYGDSHYGKAYYDEATGIVGKGGTKKLNTLGNPVQAVEMDNKRADELTLQGGLEAQFKITDYLKVNSRFGATKYYSKYREFDDIRTTWINKEAGRVNAAFDVEREKNPNKEEYANNALTYANYEDFRWTWEAFATFNKKIDLHSLEAVLGTSREKYNMRNMSSIKGYDVPNKSQYWNINHASKVLPVVTRQSYYTPRTLASYFGRIQYNYDSKYYLSATVRRDGSSAFSEMGSHWGTFPSVGLGWTISRESFLSDIALIDHIKLRGTWGRLGNQNVPTNASAIIVGAHDSDYNPVFGDDQSSVGGAAYATPIVPLNWEVTQEWGVGVDFAFLDQRLTGSLEYYNKLTRNTILEVKPRLNSGYSKEYFTHAGKIENKGVEIVMGWSDKFDNGISYDLGFNYTYNKNLVKSVKAAHDRAIGGSLSDGEITKQIRAGQPIYAWWLLEADGVWQSQAEIDAAIANKEAVVSDAKPGHLKYRDLNNDGVIDERDKGFHGSFMPSSSYGVHLGLAYKSFDVNIDGYGVAGNKVYNGLKHGRIDGTENISQKVFKNRWHGAGTSNTNPGSNRDSRASTHYLEKGDYFRINNITLGYTFKDLVFKGSSLRTYVTAQNPFIFTKYSGLSPELSTGVSAAEVADPSKSGGSPNGTSGIELSAYPTMRSFLFGVNLSF